MQTLLLVVIVLAAYGLFGAGRVGWGRWRERRGELAAQAARERAQAARPPEVVVAEVVRTGEEREAREWRTGYDAYIADWTARWDRLWADEPRDGDAPVDYTGWLPTEPEQGPHVAAIDLATLAEFEPTAVLAHVEQQNALPPVFSWHTQELPTVPVGRATITKVLTAQRAGIVHIPNTRLSD